MSGNGEEPAVDLPSVREGAAYAHALLDRIQRGHSTPLHLTTLIAFLDGDMLRGFCQVIHEALSRRTAR